MNKIWILFKREYLAAVKTKSFIISLILVPIMMGGSVIAMLLMDKNKDTSDKHFIIMDHSGLLEESLSEKAKYHNENEIYNTKSGEKVEAAYLIEFVNPKDDLFAQKLEISDKIRKKEAHAFIEIGKDILHPSNGNENAFIRYYSEHGFMDNVRYWFSNNINNYLRDLRLKELNLEPELTKNLFAWTDLEEMGLIGVDKKTGETKDAEKASELESFAIPYIIVILMFMLTLMSAVPLLTAVMEEKSEKIAEVLLGTVTPFEFMMGKVLGGIGVGLTVASLYVFGAIYSLNQAGLGSFIPMDILPWFFVYLILYIIMVGSGMAALGATCNDNKDAQSLQFPAMFPVIFPMFVIMPIMQNPNGVFATTLSFIPPITPTVMMIRMATPVSVPVWQPLLGLVLVVLFTLFTVWIGARVFRTAILIQGQKPSFKNIFKYAFSKK